MGNRSKSRPTQSKSVNWIGGRKAAPPGKSVNWHGRLPVLLLPVLLLTLLMTSPSPQAVAFVKAQPALVELAGKAPDGMVRVIAQRIDPTADIESMIAMAGGKFLKELPIISAFVAEMPAGEAVELAANTAVRWVSLDGPVESAGKPPKNPSPDPLPDTYYLDTLNVRPVWQMGFDGSGIGIAVIDSGITVDTDFAHLGQRISFSSTSNTVNDVYGHGTHVAGIIAGDGTDSSGHFQGIAPGANLISLKISDEQGMAYESDVVDAMQWVLDNKDSFNIRVVNMSLNSLTPSSYHDNPMSAAAEILWFNGIVVVVSSGNSSGSTTYDTIHSAPAHDPFLITVGAVDENDSASRSDDTIPTFSAWGTTNEGFLKPEIVAPGKDIYSVLSKSSTWGTDYPDRTVGEDEYFRLSGTSMSAPMVSGAAALLLQAEPNLTPDQVKYRLIDSAGWVSGWPSLDVFAAITTPTTQSSNTGIQASQLLWTGSDPITWGSVNWGSVNWGSVNWGSVNWGSVNWGSVNWGSVSWE